MPQRQDRKSPSNQVRIIGGEWRGRKLNFTSADGLRPTGDRTREMLFNWLAMDVINANVLDLCAGTGALGIEAISRGAQSAIFVEPNSEVSHALEDNLGALNANSSRVARCSAEAFLASDPPYLFDIVFVDPPFSEEMHTRICKDLENSGMLSEKAIIYIESPAKSDFALPLHWRELKNKTMGAVNSRLLIRDCEN